MPHKLMRMHRTSSALAPGRRPVMLAIAGDSAAGKTTLASGLVRALGPDRSTAVSVDFYDYGAPVSITIPAADQTTDFAAMLGTLGATSSGG